MEEDLLNFSLNGSSSKQKNVQRFIPVNGVMSTLIGERRQSIENNPFDRAIKQVESYGSDPFEMVSAQTLNYSPVMSSVIETGNLIDIGMEGNKENVVQNERRQSIESSIPVSQSSPRKGRTASHDSSTSRRDSLLKYSIANASKSAMARNSMSNEISPRRMSEKWMEMIPDDSFNDLMKQEINLVDSDGSDFEVELDIPILKRIDGEKKESPTEEKPVQNDYMFHSESSTIIIDRAIAKLNEIKTAQSRSIDLNDTMIKLKEMVSRVEGSAQGEASQLLNQLALALSRKSNNNDFSEPPPTMIRQGTFDIDKPSENNHEISDSSANSSNHSETNLQVQTVIEQLSRALGSVNLNVIQANCDENSASNPVVVVVVNPESGFGMSETVTLNSTTSYNTPSPKARARRSQSFNTNSSRPSIVSQANPIQKASAYLGTPQRQVEAKRRSFSFSKRPSIVPPSPSVSLAQKRVVPQVKEAKPAPIKSGFLDRLKPKLGLGASNAEKKVTKQVPLKATVPMRSVTRTNSPDRRSIRSLPAHTTPIRPAATSTPMMSRIATPQKATQSRVSFLTPSRPSTSTTSMIGTPAKNVPRRRSFNDKEKPIGLTASRSMPRPSTTIPQKPSTIGTLTQRKFPPQSASSTTRSMYAPSHRPVTSLRPLKK